ncbi:MAG: DUF3566 domain-containing protein [Actinomycetota bacterium]|nr:DUF3566 domain-containing protein [Actinomycetota bacterium]
MARAKATLESVDSGSRRAPKQKVQKQRSGPVPVKAAYERRYRQTIRKIDLWSVLKISICFYLTALIVLIVAGMVMWSIASAAGIIGNLEDFVGEMIDADDFKFLSWEVLRASTLLGLVFVCLMVVISVLAAAFYNLFSELLGGVEVTVVEEEGR